MCVGFLGHRFLDVLIGLELVYDIVNAGHLAD